MEGKPTVGIFSERDIQKFREMIKNNPTEKFSINVNGVNITELKTDISSQTVSYIRIVGGCHIACRCSSHSTGYIRDDEMAILNGIERVILKNQDISDITDLASCKIVELENC